MKKLQEKQKLQDQIEVPKQEPKVDYYKAGRRGFTTSLALPSSIVDNAQSLELKTYLVSLRNALTATLQYLAGHLSSRILMQLHLRRLVGQTIARP